ncbi:ABC transporter substrate-binding protein [Aeromicrobium wangtongii]|uniref:ABC transporter substrate-binding protein n=1 Tax=Aeromicrobium wangtongii TaxID=2969247 RepID=A0ABY5MDG9_9ACTN|nr:ABC transporter substrate-binding protein [Aeromicrobium wangtongii]MCD9197702.1 ABC transporter substrate-binding protein [Aeromicrobium wangtongii]UUP15186.1 ABC transporter substrate-binding protein [Aeromicrobium wangtongii]
MFRNSARGGRTKRFCLRLGVIAIAVSVIAACSGSDSGGDSNDSDGPKLSGEPVKVMTITSLNSQGPVYPMIKTTAEAYEKWINSNGGINGRPLETVICDDQGQATQASACARKAVEENVVAAVGSYSFFGDAIVPILEDAGISWFGTCCAATPLELTSDVSFPVGSSLMYAVGFIQRAHEDGCKDINAVVIDGAQSYIEPMENAMKAYGMAFKQDPIILPQTSQDDGPYVARATKDSDCIVMVVSESLWKPWFAAYKAAGAKQRLYGPQGNLDAVSIKGFEDVAEGSIIAGSYPDIAAEPWADFREALDEADAPDDQDFNSLGGLGTWAGYSGFTQIASNLTDLNAKSFMEAAAATTNLDLKGMVPPIDFTKPWTDGLKGYERLFNRSVYFSEVKDGKIVPLTTEPANVSDLALGIAPQ